MTEPFLAEIRIFSFNFAPRGWAQCNGQLLPINLNPALFSLMGTTYGGDGRVNFALPDLRDRIPIHSGSGFVLGERAGEASHTLTQSELPMHVHGALSSPGTGNLATPGNNDWAPTTQKSYSASYNTNMNPQALMTVGGSQPHANMPPYLVLNFCIALQGLFPSQN
jgi:microcystin-dependent protein